MDKLFSSGLIVLAFGCSAMAVQAMPFSSNPNRSNLVLPAADGCGFNKYRDARGICRPQYVIERYRKRPLYGACSGVNSYRVCNLYGRCWMACD